jgi:hypothetical protein
MMDLTTNLPSLLYAKRAHIPSRIQFASWPAGALNAIASLFDMTEAWQAGLYAVVVGWYWPRMILGKRCTHQHLARNMDQIVETKGMSLLGSFQPAYLVAICICGQTPGRSQRGWLHIASRQGIAGI